MSSDAKDIPRGVSEELGELAFHNLPESSLFLQPCFYSVGLILGRRLHLHGIREL